ncbi:MAG: hypothetical protein SNG35_01495 [Rikenellaceae bacterium]
MKRSDLIFLGVVIIAALPFFVSSKPAECYDVANATHPYMLAFLKFAILATVGEMIGLRIRSGSYTYEGFGAMPRAILWGVYGVWIALAMKIFAAGTPMVVETLGIDGVVAAMKQPGFSPEKLLGGFSISLMLNTIFAPVFMTMHKITDAHIVACGGSLKALVPPLPMRKLFVNLDWDTQWNFVFKKTIPLFWIPAHTITFMLPPASQVLFAALLSVALGVIMALATVISQSKKVK